MRLMQSVKVAVLCLASSALGSSLYAVERSYNPGDHEIPIRYSLFSGIAAITVPTDSALTTFSRSPVAAGDDSTKPKQTDSAAPSLPVTVCVDLPEWQRPSEQTQRKRLEQMERYQGLLDDETLVSLAKDWWTHEIFSFTTYGLSARTDPHYLSGIWTALDDIWGCYDGEQPRQINDGELAELWLVNHRLVDLTWQNQQYVITVESNERGLQLLHFPRSERYDILPVVVITQTGSEVSVMSGDW